MRKIFLLAVCLMLFHASAWAKKVDTSNIEMFFDNKEPTKKYEIVGFVKAQGHGFRLIYFVPVKSKDAFQALKVKAAKLHADAIIKVSCGSKTHIDGADSVVDSHEVPVCTGYAVKWVDKK